MALSLDQYAETLFDRKDIVFPAVPEVAALKARPSIVRIAGLKAIFWNVYGTLLAIAEGDLKYQSDNDFMLNIALDKTIQEFKMWASMSRKPGQPADYMKEIYGRALNEARMLPSKSEKYPETRTEAIWESIVKRLLQKEYKFDAGLYGSLNQYAQKIAFFFHASMQATGAMPGAARAIRHLSGAGIAQGLYADGQCFTAAHLGWCLRQQDESLNFDQCVPAPNRLLSFDRKARKPSMGFREQLLERLEAMGVAPGEALVVGSNVDRDLAPAKQAGLRTALFVGDKLATDATADQLKDKATSPDMLVTELAQLELLIG